MALIRLPPVLLYAALAGLVIALGVVRIVTGPWYAVYGPDGARLLDGAPASWEARYYLDHVGTFNSDRQPTHGFAAVHHRTLVFLYLASLLYAWTGRIHASFAAVDLTFWFLASVAAYHVARRFHCSNLGAAIAALVTAASPVLVSNMWRHDLHVANFASVMLGLWGMLAAVDHLKRERELIPALGVLLLLLSLTYQYQWTLLPVLLVLLRARAHFPLFRVARVAAGALVIFVIGTLAWRALLHAGGLSPSGIDTTVVSDPAQLLTGRLARMRSPADLLRLLPSIGHLENTIHAYHPLVFVAGWAGLVFLPRHLLLSALAASAAALFAISLYSAPWTAMSAYPFLYVGAGHLCSLPARWRAGPGIPIALTTAGLLVAVTNTDLWGDYSFLLEWWRQYAQQTVF